MGMNEEQKGQTAQAFFKIMNMLALNVAPPPTPSQEAPAAMPASPEQAAMEQDEEEEDQQEPDDQGEGDLTDGSTDSEAEAKAASENLPPTKIRKKKREPEERAARIRVQPTTPARRPSQESCRRRTRCRDPVLPS